MRQRTIVVGGRTIVLKIDGDVVYLNDEKKTLEEVVEYFRRLGVLQRGRRERGLGVASCVRCRIRYYVEVDRCYFCSCRVRVSKRLGSSDSGKTRIVVSD